MQFRAFLFPSFQSFLFKFNRISLFFFIFLFFLFGGQCGFFSFFYIPSPSCMGECIHYIYSDIYCMVRASVCVWLCVKAILFSYSPSLSRYFHMSVLLFSCYLSFLRHFVFLSFLFYILIRVIWTILSPLSLSAF